MPELPLVVNDFSASFNLIQTPYGLIIDALNIKGSRVVVETDPLVVKMDRPGTWEAFVEEAALQAFVEGRVPGQLRNVKVSVIPGEIRVAGTVNMIVDIGVEAVCGLIVKDGRQLWVELKTVSVGGGAAKNLVQQQLDKLNPVLDVKDLPLDLRFTTVTILKGEIVVEGTVEPS